jgi:hypothetical protein
MRTGEGILVAICTAIFGPIFLAFMGINILVDLTRQEEVDYSYEPIPTEDGYTYDPYLVTKPKRAGIEL